MKEAAVAGRLDDSKDRVPDKIVCSNQASDPGEFA
jgi:hypothetical protein